MQKENTTLIAECNRLRKNLHELFMHVNNIELFFGKLTGCNTNLTKADLVGRIKNYIKNTIHQIELGYKGYKEEPRNTRKDDEDEEVEKESSLLLGNNNIIIKSLDDNKLKFLEQQKDLEQITKNLHNTVNKDEGEYELIKLPDIMKNKNIPPIQFEKSQDNSTKNDGILPIIKI